MRGNAKYHNIWRRLGARLIDGLLLFGLEWVLDEIPAPHIVLEFILYVFSYGVGIAYYVCLHAKYGQTVGKRILQIKVVQFKTEELITLKKAVVRELVPILFVAVTLAIFFFETATGRGVGSVTEQMPEWLAFSGTGLVMLWLVADTLMALSDPERRSIHDYMAGSAVVRVQTETTVSNNLELNKF